MCLKRLMAGVEMRDLVRQSGEARVLRGCWRSRLRSQKENGYRDEEEHLKSEDDEEHVRFSFACRIAEGGGASPDATALCVKDGVCDVGGGAGGWNVVDAEDVGPGKDGSDVSRGGGFVSAAL